MLETKEKIKAWLKHHHIKEYDIHDDLSVEVFETVLMTDKALKEIPVAFDKIHGDFDCSYNQLTILPNIREVTKDFLANDNQLISIENLPQIGGKINLRNNKIESLKGLPTKINSSLFIDNNQLTSLKYCAKYIDGFFECSNNPLKSLSYLPEQVRMDIMCLGVMINIETTTKFNKVKKARKVLLDGKNDVLGNLTDYYMFVPDKNKKIINYIEIELEVLKKYQEKFQLKEKMHNELSMSVVEKSKPKI